MQSKDGKESVWTTLFRPESHWKYSTVAANQNSESRISHVDSTVIGKFLATISTLAQINKIFMRIQMKKTALFSHEKCKRNDYHFAPVFFCCVAFVGLIGIHRFAPVSLILRFLVTKFNGMHSRRHCIYITRKFMIIVYIRTEKNKQYRWVNSIDSPNEPAKQIRSLCAELKFAARLRLISI